MIIVDMTEEVKEQQSVKEWEQRGILYQKQSDGSMLITCREKWQRVWTGALIRGLEDEEVVRETKRFLDGEIAKLERKVAYYENIKKELGCWKK